MWGKGTQRSPVCRVVHKERERGRGSDLSSTTRGRSLEFDLYIMTLNFSAASREKKSAAQSPKMSAAKCEEVAEGGRQGQEQQQQQGATATTTQRRRYHSWSRIRRGKPPQQLQQQPPPQQQQQQQEHEHEVQAETHICFAKDGSWFQVRIKGT